MPNPFDDRRPQARAKIAAIYAFLIAANCAVWAWAWLSFSNQPTLMGTAFLAYLFGLRHAFDADHIAAIDNVVRKVMQEGKYPVSVGFFFAIGHSTIVVLASIAIAATAAAMQGRLEAFHDLGGTIGTAIAALFLLAIGLANLFVLKGIWAVFSRVRRGGQIIDNDLDALLAGRGFFARIFRPMFRLVSRSWHMYPIGFLFGLGFDSGTICGQIADRTGRSDLILGVCLLAGIASLLLLPQPGWAVPLSLVFGLLGVAPAGLMMALTGVAMAPHKRAFGMGVFLSVYFLGSAIAPRPRGPAVRPHARRLPADPVRGRPLCALPGRLLRLSPRPKDHLTLRSGPQDRVSKGEVVLTAGAPSSSARDLLARVHTQTLGFDCHVIEEARQGRGATRPSREPAVDADRHHLRRARALGVKVVERVLHRLQPAVALRESGRHGELHVVHFERVGNDEMQLPSTSPSMGGSSVSENRSNRESRRAGPPRSESSCRTAGVPADRRRAGKSVIAFTAFRT